MDKINRWIKNLKDLQKDLESFEVSIKADEDGYIDKECPNKDCLFQFKVDAEDWGNKFGDSKVYCPNCKNESPANSYYPSELIDQVKTQLIKHVREKLINGRRFPYKLLPYETTKKWNLKIECESCKSKYSVIGSAFFCPCCGIHSSERTFNDSIEKVKIKINDIEIVRKSLAESIGVDRTEVIIRSLKETCLSDCVVLFQHYLNYCYEKITNKKPKFNVFQRIDNGSKTWRNEIGKGYEDWITMHEKQLMNKLFQQRHLFQHSDGNVDQMYINKSGDTKYQVGQRIVVHEKEVIELVRIILKISKELKKYGA